jgi:stage III sporulation protein AE
VLHQSFANPRVAAIANLVTMMALFSLAVHSLYVSLEYAAAAVQRMSDFMLAIFPLFMMLLATLGNLLSAAMMEPVLMAMTQLVGRLISQFIFPLILFAALLHMVSAMHEQLKFTRLAQLLTTIGMTVMTVTFTVFMAVLSFQGAFVATADGLAVRAAKFVAGNFVPVVGRMFADATDTVLGASLVVKNTVGLVGLLIVFLLCAFPALKVLVIAFIYKLAAALLQPLGDSSFGTVLETIGNSLLYVFGAVAALGLMFFFTLTVIISLGNISLMVR